MFDSKQKIASETLPANTKLITSLREQRGKGKLAISLINKTLKVAKKQAEYLKKLSKKSVNFYD